MVFFQFPRELNKKGPFLPKFDISIPQGIEPKNVHLYPNWTFQFPRELDKIIIFLPKFNISIPLGIEQKICIFTQMP